MHVLKLLLLFAKYSSVPPHPSTLCRSVETLQLLKEPKSMIAYTANKPNFTAILKALHDMWYVAVAIFAGKH